jgi:hypothetical protein
MVTRNPVTAAETVCEPRQRIPHDRSAKQHAVKSSGGGEVHYHRHKVEASGQLDDPAALSLVLHDIFGLCRAITRGGAHVRLVPWQI